MIALLLTQTAAAALLTLTAAAVGELVTGGAAGQGKVEGVAVRLAVGLGGLGTLLALAAATGALYRAVVLGLVAALLAAAAVRWRRRRGSKAATTATPAAADTAPPAKAPAAAHAAAAGLPRHWALALGALAVLPAGVWSLYPPMAYDATAYHLPFARAFADSHRLVVMPELVLPVLPQLVDVLFAGLLLATAADVTTHLVQLLAMATTAGLLYALGRRAYGRRAGVLAAALWLAHPLVHYQAASAYIDVTFALFCVLSLLAWEAWRAQGGGRWLGLAGAGAGFAAASKHLGLVWLAALLAMTLVAAQRGRRLRGAAVLILVAAAIAGPWYARQHRLTGNPIYPLLGPLFGAEPRPFDRRVGVGEGASLTSVPAAVARRLADLRAWPAELARFAWQASFHRAAFNRQSPLAPWHLALAPLAAGFAIGDPALRRWLLLALVYAALWTTRDPRFQLPTAAVLALAGAGALDHLIRRLPAAERRLQRPGALAALAGTLLAPGPAYAVYKLAQLGAPPPTTPAARAALLARHQPGYAGIRHLNETYGSGYTVYTLAAPELAHHLQGGLRGGWSGELRFRAVAALAGEPARLYARLRRAGVDALLVTLPDPRQRLRAAPDSGKHFRHVLGDDHFDLYVLEPSPAAGAGDADRAAIHQAASWVGPTTPARDSATP